VHFAEMNDRYYLKLVKEPRRLKAQVEDKKKSVKVKMVLGRSQKEDLKILAEEEVRMSQSRMAKAKEKKTRQTSTASLDKNFLEDGFAGRAKEEYEDDGFVEQDNVEDEGSVRSKRARQQPVDEDRIFLRSKSKKRKMELRFTMTILSMMTKMKMQATRRDW